MDSAAGPTHEAIFRQAGNGMIRRVVTIAALLASSAAHAECSTRDLAGNWRAYIHFSGSATAPLACRLAVNSSGRLSRGTCWMVPLPGEFFEAHRGQSPLSVSGSCVVTGAIYLPGRHVTLVLDTGSLTGLTAHGLGYESSDVSPGTSKDFSFVLAKH